jgi:hypothetical protein
MCMLCALLWENPHFKKQEIKIKKCIACSNHQKDRTSLTWISVRRVGRQSDIG